VKPRSPSADNDWSLWNGLVTNGASLAFAIILARKIKFRGSVFDGEEFLKGQSAFVGAQHAAPLRQSHLKFTTCTIGYMEKRAKN